MKREVEKQLNRLNRINRICKRLTINTVEIE